MTTKKLFIAFLMLFMISLNACDVENKCIKSSGSTETKTINLASFSGVDFRLPGNVEVIKSNASKVVIDAQESIIDHIRTDIISGNLRIDLTNNQCIKGRTDLKFKVYTSELSYLRVAGSGNIQSAEEFPVNSWKLIIDGSGDINARINGTNTEAVVSGSGSFRLKGVTDQFKTRVSGSGNILGFDVLSKLLDASISGSGNIEASVSEKLQGSISGSGNIRYKGQPVVDQISISGSGKLVKVN
jgi:hypothetical protein